MARDVIQGEVLPDLDHAIDVFIQWRETPKDILFGLTPVSCSGASSQTGHGLWGRRFGTHW